MSKQKEFLRQSFDKKCAKVTKSRSKNNSSERPISLEIHKYRPNLQQQSTSFYDQKKENQKLGMMSPSVDYLQNCETRKSRKSVKRRRKQSSMSGSTTPRLVTTSHNRLPSIYNQQLVTPLRGAIFEISKSLSRPRVSRQVSIVDKPAAEMPPEQQKQPRFKFVRNCVLKATNLTPNSRTPRCRSNSKSTSSLHARTAATNRLSQLLLTTPTSRKKCLQSSKQFKK